MAASTVAGVLVASLLVALSSEEEYLLRYVFVSLLVVVRLRMERIRSLLALDSVLSGEADDDDDDDDDGGAAEDVENPLLALAVSPSSVRDRAVGGVRMCIPQWIWSWFWWLVVGGWCFPGRKSHQINTFQKSMLSLQRTSEWCTVQQLTMALPARLQRTFTPQELQFITENTSIEILPRYTMASIDLITTTIPPLRAMQRATVPVWVAVILKQQHKCSIVPPDWLTVPQLKHHHTVETKQLNSFSELPDNWLEVSKLFFDFAHDDLSDEVHKFRALVQDLKEIRMIKVRRGIAHVNESNLQLDNLSVLEINEIRPLLVQTMGKLAALDKAVRGQPETVAE